MRSNNNQGDKPYYHISVYDSIITADVGRLARLISFIETTTIYNCLEVVGIDTGIGGAKDYDYMSTDVYKRLVPIWKEILENDMDKMKVHITFPDAAVEQIKTNKKINEYLKSRKVSRHK